MFTFADSSKMYINLLVTPRRLKNKTVAMERKPTENQIFFFKVLFPLNLSILALTRNGG